MAEVLLDEGCVDLPTEVLEVVLSQLPLSYLLTTVATVSRRWSEVALNPSFLPWKKVYHQFKFSPSSQTSALLLSPDRIHDKLSAEEVINKLADHHEITELPSCLVNIVKLMGSTHRIPREDVTPRLLECHPLCRAALDTLARMAPTLIPLPHNTWHIATMIILLSTDMWEVDQVLRLLLHRGSVFTSCDVLEAFYCLATFLLYSTHKLHLPTRYHYIVYYALYLYENSWSSPPSNDPGTLQHGHAGQQSLTPFVTRVTTPHTHEQMRIINHKIQPDHVVKIVAFAGTGKTTTLLQYCKQRPHQKFLLVVYNKSVQEHCERMFPPNTTARTAHSLAYATVGRRFGAIRKMNGNINASNIATFLEKKKDAGNRYRRAALVKNTVERYLNSADETLTLRHVPETDNNNEKVDDDLRLKILLPDAESVWAEMKKCSSTQQLSMSQDGQLKLWQLRRPELSTFDIIMVDEAQDMNATMFDVFLNQPCAKVIVGDPYQQIYSFRGAVNALSMVPATHTFHLTQSFRFGPEVGYMAHCALETLLGVRRHTLVGGWRRDSFTTVPDSGTFRIPSEAAGIPPGQAPQNVGATVEAPQDKGSPSKIKLHSNSPQKKSSPVKFKISNNPGARPRMVRRAYLGRTNLEVYKVALTICQDQNFEDATIAFAGGIQKYDFDTVMDVYKLSQVQAGHGTPETLGIKKKFIAKFSTVSALKSFSENLEDHELRNKILMYEYSGERTPHHLNLLKKRCMGSKTVSQADVTFTTIHKAKGLEWDWVILLDDHPPLGILTPQPASVVGDEHNLLYVAITRAKTFLTLNSAALFTLTRARDKLESLVPQGDAIVDEATKCVQCGNQACKDTKHTLLTQVCPMELGFRSDKFLGGYICQNCATFHKFLPPMVRRHIRQQLEYIPDSSRVARRMLLEGKVADKQATGCEGAMERGWHNYRMRQRGGGVGGNILQDEWDFFDIAQDDNVIVGIL